MVHSLLKVECCRNRQLNSGLQLEEQSRKTLLNKSQLPQHVRKKQPSKRIFGVPFGFFIIILSCITLACNFTDIMTSETILRQWQQPRYVIVVSALVAPSSNTYNTHQHQIIKYRDEQVDLSDIEKSKRETSLQPIERYSNDCNEKSATETSLIPFGAYSNNVEDEDQERQQEKKEYYLTSTYAKYNIELLQDALQKQIRYSSSASVSVEKENNPLSFTERDADIVINSIFVASKNDVRLISDAAEFLTLLISVEDYHYAEVSNDDDNVFDRNSGCNSNDLSSDAEFFTVMTRDTLIAAAFHYCECVVAREAGVYDLVNGVMRNTHPIGIPLARIGADNDVSVGNSSSLDQTLIHRRRKEDKVDEVDMKRVLLLKPGNYDDTSDSTSEWGVGVNEEEETCLVAMNADTKEETIAIHSPLTLDNDIGIERYGKDAIEIYESAARIKRAEIMAKVVRSSSSSKSPGWMRQGHSDDSAASLSGLLLSMTDDWRGLAIRSTASLYRLRGVLRHDYSSTDYFKSFSGIKKDDTTSLSSNIRRSSNNDNIQHESRIMLAREALQVYSPLAQRLGMNQLKTELENTAFRVLYKRQYALATSLYTKNGSALQSVTSFVKESAEEILQKDEWLSGQLERLTVMARVKQPYSLWRKLVKRRIKVLYSKDGSPAASDTQAKVEPLSLSQINDAIAIRVILEPKRVLVPEGDLEDDRSSFQSSAHEELLCYYVQNLLLKLYPSTDGRIKDYIKIPKPNGYQSLHHTAEIVRYGHEWPFEIQIRSETMHRRSESGVAAHWDYKIQGGNTSTNNNTNMDSDQLSSSTNINSYVTLQEPVSRSLLSRSLDFSDGSKATDNYEDQTHKLKKLSHASMVKSYIDALTTARSHLLKESVFIFISPSSSALDGRVIGIPSGSTIADALVEVNNRSDYYNEDFLNKKELVLLNGHKSSTFDILSNGDVLTLPGLSSTSHAHA